MNINGLSPLEHWIQPNALKTFLSLRLDSVDIFVLKCCSKTLKVSLDKLYPPLKSYDKAKWIVIVAMEKGYWKITKWFLDVTKNEIPYNQNLCCVRFVKKYPVYKQEDLKDQEFVFKTLFPKQSFDLGLVLNSENPLLILSKLHTLERLDICISKTIEIGSIDILEELNRLLYLYWPMYITNEHKTIMFFCNSIKMLNWAVEHGIEFSESDIPDNYHQAARTFIQERFPGWFEKRIKKLIYFVNDEEIMLNFANKMSLRFLFDEALKAKHYKVLTKIIEEYDWTNSHIIINDCVLDLPLEWIKKLHNWNQFKVFSCLTSDDFDYQMSFEKLKFLNDENIITSKQFLKKLTKPDKFLAKDPTYQKFILSKQTLEWFNIDSCDSKFSLLLIEKFPKCLISFDWKLVRDPKLVVALTNHKNKNQRGSLESLFLQFESLEICLAILPFLEKSIQKSITDEIAKGKTWIFELLKHPLTKKHNLFFWKSTLKESLCENHYYQTYKALEEFQSIN